MRTQVIGGLIIAMCSSMMGYGYSQSTLALIVKAHDRDIIALAKTHDLDVSALRQNDDNCMHRIDKIAELLNELVKQNTELITLIRIQNNIQKP
jgi:hypothetical protein